MKPILGTESAPQLAELQATVRRYQDRYGELSGMFAVAKASSALATRQRRLDALAAESKRIQQQMDTMNSEVRRLERWVGFCLEDVISQAKQDHAEGWSPTPVLGFRLWVVRDDGLCGVKLVWPGRTLKATCLSDAGTVEIPHTDGRCGRLGCGVYAAKSVDPLYTEFDVSAIGDIALGVVALTGKVVEHDDGYRAAEATVVAIGASRGPHLLLTTDPDRIDDLFTDPSVVLDEPAVEAEMQRLMEMEAFVIEEARRSTPWTLEISSE